MLVHTDVTRYLEFKQIAGSYVYRDGKIAKVPSNESEAIRSSLMGLFEKNRARKFFGYVAQWNPEDPTTLQGELNSNGSLWSVTDTCRLRCGHPDNEGPLHQVRP